MLKTYSGSCHCGAVRYEVDLDLAKGTTRCNCRICTKTRSWGTHVKPDAFRLLTPEDALSSYAYAASIRFLFCRTCGVRSFGRGNLPQLGGDFVTIQVNCLDDATPEELLSGPVQFCDGRANAWWNAPAETRHL